MRRHTCHMLAVKLHFEADVEAPTNSIVSATFFSSLSSSLQAPIRVNNIKYNTKCPSQL